MMRLASEAVDEERVVAGEVRQRAVEVEEDGPNHQRWWTSGAISLS